jgi:hypothetical protein
MEKNKAKEIKLNAVENKNTEKKSDVQKLTYEQLEQMAQQLSIQNRRLTEAVSNLSAEYNYKITMMLLGIIGHKDVFSEDFIKKCASNIEQGVTSLFREVKDK